MVFEYRGTLDSVGSPSESGARPTLAGHRPGDWAWLEEPAGRLGLVAAGVAPAGAVRPLAAERLRRWLAVGFHAGMGYMARNLAQRLNPSHRGIVEGANAVVCVALPYGDGAARAGIWRFVSSHARSIDYHAGIGRRLEALRAEITARFPGCRSRCFTDTAPLMEREWAALAGLGAVGRHGGLIVPGLGARVALGEIVVAGAPAPERVDPPPDFALCGDCRLCERECPTGAISSEGRVDARRCLSYHTIESRDPGLPREIAARISTIFGCDRCTDVCPLEKGVACALEPPPHPGPDDLDPENLVGLSDRRIEELIEGTALERTGSAALRRNAILLAQRREAQRS